MKKLFMLLFTAASLIICVIPFAGMTFFVSDEEIGNEERTEFPKIVTEDGVQYDYFSRLGEWFEQSFAFRPQIISADAEIQSRLFGVSNLDSVVKGRGDWLYYSSSLDDYLGRRTLSSRSVKNIVRNLKLTQDYVKAGGADFIFTVAPNKNTLYPQNMPYYYSVKSSPLRNADFLASELALAGVNYCDLFAAFKNEEEILYLKQDSHWNDKGAMLAYNAILDSLGKQHNDYAAAEAVREKTFFGDLGKMLYPATAKPEYNYQYDIHASYSYATPTKSVEDAVIKTENPAAQGSLYMYRDSFGNALLPFFANAYGKAYFTKAFPLNLSADMGANKPDTVAIELVERNIDWLEAMPPVIEAPEVTDYTVSEQTNGSGSIVAKTSDVNMQLTELLGSVDSSLCNDDTEILVELSVNGKQRLYRAFCTGADEEGERFLAYVPSSELGGGQIRASVVTSDGKIYTRVVTEDISVQ